MNWAETMKGNATAALLEHVANDERAYRRTQAMIWGPFEVWLTRIKQPCDTAAQSASAGTSNGIAAGRD